MLGRVSLAEVNIDINVSPKLSSVMTASHGRVMSISVTGLLLVLIYTLPLALSTSFAAAVKPFPSFLKHRMILARLGISIPQKSKLMTISFHITSGLRRTAEKMPPLNLGGGCLIIEKKS
jgi:hypothetical protein